MEHLLEIMDRILTVNDVAELLHVKPITVREMFREKRLRAFKVGKSWRTTEKMLQEDIDALARGEEPAVLPMPNGKSKSVHLNATEAPDAKHSKGSKRKSKSKIQENRSDIDAINDEDIINTEADEEDDDLQQFLF